MLSALGLMHTNAKILFLGLDNSGKTTLLHMLKDERLSTHIPTTHPTLEELTIGGVCFTTYDLGGHETARRLWRDYCTQVDAIVYIVDANDRARFVEAKKELDDLLMNENLARAPFLVLGNKIDVPRAASEDEVRVALGLGNTTGKGAQPLNTNVRCIELFMTSVVQRTGYKEGFQWLAQYL